MAFLLLRPNTKIEQSCNYLRAHGLDVIGLPLITIEPDLHVIQQLPGIIAAMPERSLVIFTSTHAVEATIGYLHKLPEKSEIWAIGKTTQLLLEHSGVQASVPQQQDSEGLLAELAELDKGSHVTIFKGHGGRDTLLQTLTLQGAKVVELNLYRRQKAQQPESTQPWRKKQIECIIATSGEQIEAAFEYLEPAWLRQLKWIVVSNRLARVANEFGISSVFVSQGPSDTAIAECANSYLEQ